MAVDSGFKQTEAGLIPTSWSIAPLGKDIDLVSGHHILAQHCNTHGDGVPYITGPADFPNGEIQHSKYTSKPGTMCKPRDILITVKGSGAGTLVRSDNSYCISRQLMAIRTREWSREFIYYSLLRSASRFTADAVGPIPGLSRNDILSKNIPLPPTKAEQEAIAEALSDADSLIESLEQLIATKRQIKQGAMQELLTGKRRLSGFSGEWIEKKLGDLVSLYQPVTISAKQFTESGYPVYGANGIVGFYNRSNHDSWQVTVTCRGSTCGTVNRTVDRCWITGNAMVLNCDQNTTINKEFFFHLMTNQNLSDCITGTGQPQIVRAPLFTFVVKLPSSKDEQTAIAEVLSNMDTDISVLEGRLAKARLIKQGMMQELLTGRIRLV